MAHCLQQLKLDKEVSGIARCTVLYVGHQSGDGCRYGADHALALYSWEEAAVSSTHDSAGVPVASVACSEIQAVRPPPGEFVGLSNFMRPIRSLVGA